MQLRASEARIARYRSLLLVTVVAFFAAMVHGPQASGADSDEEQSSEAPVKAAHGKKRKHRDQDQEKEKPAPQTSGDTATKQVGLEFAAYNDSDHVTVFTPSINVGVGNVSGASFTGTYLVDVVSAASVDIVSSASQRWHEVRQAGSISGQYKPHDFGVSLGGSVSSEPDYLSYGAYATVIKEFDDKNVTVNFGYGFSQDTAGRCGGLNGGCTPFSIFSRKLQRGSFDAGLAWVVDRQSLASLSGDLIIENGDQSKPYRYIPMFSPKVAPLVAAGASIDFVNANRLPERPLEQLPLSRTRFAVTGRYAHRFDGSTLRLEERVYDDSWGLVASTTDAKWIFDLGDRVEFWPHARFHTQSKVTFWQRAYVSQSAFGWDLPEYRTGDRELGPLQTFGGGLGLRWYVGSDDDPRSWQLGLMGDWMSTSFSDDLYLTSRTALFGAMTMEANF